MIVCKMLYLNVREAQMMVIKYNTTTGYSCENDFIGDWRASTITHDRRM